jgi:hypothetical protein
MHSSFCVGHIDQVFVNTLSVYWCQRNILEPCFTTSVCHAVTLHLPTWLQCIVYVHLPPPCLPQSGAQRPAFWCILCTPSCCCCCCCFAVCQALDTAARRAKACQELLQAVAGARLAVSCHQRC